MILIKTQMQVTKIMSNSNLVPVVDPMYETYANNVAPKGSLNRQQPLEKVIRYSIWKRLKKVCYEARGINNYGNLITGMGMSPRTWKIEKVSRLSMLRLYFRNLYYAFTYTPYTTIYVRENKQRLSCNEKQVKQIAEGSLEWDDAACVLKYDQLEKVERTVLQKMLDASRSTK